MFQDVVYTKWAGQLHQVVWYIGIGVLEECVLF